jgi:2-oxoisovalerate dehydrogenase E1 component
MVLASIAKTGKCLVVHEDTQTGGFAGEIIAAIADEGFTDLDGPVQRLTTIDTPIPFNIPMMNNAVIPSVEKIKQKMENLLKW